MSRHEFSSYGTSGGLHYWIAKVVDIQDPRKMHRLKIRIVGYQDTIDEKDLPWAHYHGGQGPAERGRGGPYSGAEVGSYVTGHFADTQRQFAVITHFLPKHGTGENLDQGPEQTSHSQMSLALKDTRFNPKANNHGEPLPTYAANESENYWTEQAALKDEKGNTLGHYRYA